MFRQTIWLLGFRPFFLLAALAGALLPPIWAAAFAGAIALPADGLPALAWHAHEMFYGFGWAVLGGFLLTASRNWLGYRSMHGWMLALAALLWVLERIAVFLPPSAARLVLLNAFPVYLIGYLLFFLVRDFRKGSPQNAWFIAVLPLFLVAKNLLIQPTTWVAGVAMTVGLFRLPFALMFERLIPMFMRNAMGVHVVRRPWLDTAIKATLFASIFQPFLPAAPGAALVAAACLFLLVRLFEWAPLAGLRRIEIGSMYVGYAGLVIHLALEALRIAGVIVGVGTVATHAFTLLTMGMVIASMMVRVSMGHTGRKIAFTAAEHVALVSMGVAAFFRLVAPQIHPGLYTTFIALSGAAWSLCYLVVLFRLAPMLLRPRVDGREI